MLFLLIVFSLALFSCAPAPAHYNNAEKILPAIVTEQPGSTQTQPGTAQQTACTDVGCLAPEFNLASPDGSPISLNSFKGKKVILAFLSTRCSTCLEVTVCLQKIYDAWAREQLEIISIISHEKSQDVTAWIKLYGTKNTVALDPDGKVYDLYRPDKVPGLFFLNTDGIIKIKKYAPFDDCVKGLDALLQLY